MRIQEVAARTGFPASTLRYYEEIGLLPAPERTEAGYRSYDDRTVERLTFIGRAKQLGCTLEEITGLVAAFDTDCHDVHAQLRDLVGAKVADARRQTADLVALTAQLEAAAAALAGSDGSALAVGPCDEGCACVDHAVADSPAIVCTLTGADDIAGRIDDWRAVLAAVRARTPIADGLRLSLADGAPLHDLARLVEAEQGCCAFFAFAITVDGRGTALEVTAPAGGQAVLESLFG
jgi:MerR family copper efflux transcriptional regulator